MQRDFLHYQANFRALLHAIAYPGDRVKLIDVTQGHSFTSYVFSQSILEVLVDGEVSLLTLPQQKDLEAEVKIFTNVRIVTQVEQADYIWVEGQALSNRTEFSFLDAVKVGQLEDPEQSATLIIAVANVTGMGTPVHMQGPGIKASLEDSLPLSPAFLAWRAQMNNEFPLGIDIILVDQQGQAMALPRTTSLKWEDVQWAM